MRRAAGRKKAEKKTARWQADRGKRRKTVKTYADSPDPSVLSYKEALNYAESMDVLLIPYELASGMAETKEILQKIRSGQSVGIFIGRRAVLRKKK